MSTSFHALEIGDTIHYLGLVWKIVAIYPADYVITICEGGEVVDVGYDEVILSY